MKENNYELIQNSTIAFFATVQLEGNRKVERLIPYYNLDMILAVGYRVKSNRGILFRSWANSILKQYLLNGQVINKERCIAHSDNIIMINNTINQINSKINLMDSNITNINHRLFNVNISLCLKKYH